MGGDVYRNSEAGNGATSAITIKPSIHLMRMSSPNTFSNFESISRRSSFKSRFKASSASPGSLLERFGDGFGLSFRYDDFAARR